MSTKVCLSRVQIFFAVLVVVAITLSSVYAYVKMAVKRKIDGVKGGIKGVLVDFAEFVEDRVLSEERSSLSPRPI
jgi:hypothetical protein